jgi:uncharacterized protein (TIGR03437 family)
MTTAFSTTDTAAYSFFDVAGVNAGDTFTVAFYNPSGTLYAGAGGTVYFNPATSAGEWCYAPNSAPLLIAGNPAATMPGTWTVQVFYNSNYTVAFLSGTFTITAPAACTYTLSGSGASSPGVTGGTFNVTAPAGCAWAAVSDSPTWLTTTSSGSGSGTVTYTVTAANTSTSSRVGHITVGGQTFTITQAGSSAGGTSITITNPGFETIPSNPAWIDCSGTGGAGCRATGDGNIPGWTASSTTTIGLFQPGSTYFTVPMPAAEGQTLAYSNGGTISQVLSATLQASTLYTLQVDVGLRLDNHYPSPPPTVQLFAGNTLIASATGAQPPLGGWTTWTGTYQSSASDPLAGQPLKIVLGSTGQQGDFDNVRLTASGAGTSVTITNPGFETIPSNPQWINCAGNGGPGTGGAGCQDTLNGNVPGWTASNTTSIGLFQPGPNLFTVPMPTAEGLTLAQVSSGTLSQVLSATLQTSTLYTLQVDVGRRMDNLYPSPPPTVLLFAGNTQIASATGAQPPLGGWTTWTGTYQSSASDPLAGQALKIVLGATAVQGDFDNVRLTASGAGGGTGSCGYSLSASSASPAAAQSTGSVTVTVTSGSGCSWTVANNLSWITITSANSFTGNGTVTYSVAANTGAARSGSFTIAGQPYTVNQAASGGTSSCNPYVSPQSQSQPATGSGGGNITGQITVTTSANCTWTAVSNSSWITIVAGATGSGNGAVSYRVDPNTATTSRQGTMTIAGQTVTVTQAAGVACSYSINPTNDAVQALGGSSSITVTVTAGTSCSWTASVSSSASSWLHLGSTTSGTGNGTVSYSADANTSAASRTGTITVAGLTFTLTQPGGASATGPNIGGIVDAVNYRAAIAQGSFFAIFGTKLGPTPPQPNEVFPIPDNLGGVTVTVTQGSITKKAYLVYVSDSQINAIMPSDAPLGNVQVTVNYNGTASGTATVVNISFAINSTAGGNGPGIINNYNSPTDQPLNTASNPAKPGQVEIMVGTGLGPITAPDNQSPPVGVPTTPVQVLVGDQQASVSYSGRAPLNAGQDQINFTVPANAPLGCSIPVQVSAGGTWSNTVRMAISADGSHCQDTFNPLAGLSATGGNSGTLGLIRMNFNGQLSAGAAPTNASLDLGFGAFTKTNPGGDLAYSPLSNLPPPGTCASTNKGNFDVGTLMGGGLSGLDPTVAATLDAGPQLTVTGGAGGATGTLTQTSPNPYMGLLGGVLNISGATVPPPFLDGGPFTISGPGGKDVGPFKTTVPLSPAITWTNPPSTINRASPLTLNWTGGDSTETVVILGVSTDSTSKAMGQFLCVAPAGVHSFTVPVNSLADLISTTPTSSSSSPIGFLGLMPMHFGSSQTFTATGLNVGVVFDTTMSLQTVQVQ